MTTPEPTDGNRKLHPEDPRLTAHALGELSEKDAAVLAAACAADPALAAALDDLREVERHVSRAFAAIPPLELEDVQRDALRKAAAASGPKPFPVAGVLLGSAILILAMVIIALYTGRKPAPAPAVQAPPAKPPVLVKPADPRLPAPGPDGAGVTSPGGPVSDLYPALGKRDAVSVEQAPSLPLPLKAGDRSMEWVRHSILTENKLPPRDAVRTEELLNSIALRPTGAAVLRGATLSAETLPCPWKPSSTLLFAEIKGKRDASCAVTTAFYPAVANVARYRLLGWLPAAGQKETMTTTLAKGSSVRLMIELEISAAAPDLGEIRWTIDGKDAPPLAIVRKPDAEPSDDARFAALVCLFSEWLSGNNRAAIDAEILSACARELSAPGIPRDREEFLQLIDRAIRL